MLNKTKKFLEKSWIQDIDDYLNATLKTGILIESYFKDVHSILQIERVYCRVELNK